MGKDKLDGSVRIRETNRSVLFLALSVILTEIYNTHNVLQGSSFAIVYIIVLNYTHAAWPYFHNYKATSSKLLMMVFTELDGIVSSHSQK
jgi:hypothetical protein